MKRWCITFFICVAFFTGGLVRAQSIGLSFRDTLVYKGAMVNLPVYADSSLSGNGIYAYTLQVEFCPQYLQFDSVLTAGTLSEGFGDATYKLNKISNYTSVLTVVGSGSKALEGSGIFLYLRFKTLTTGYIPVRFSSGNKCFFNEGSPTLTLNKESCYLIINESPSLSISPSRAALIKGESLQMEAFYGTAPYSWHVTDTVAAVVSATGLLTAMQVGTTKVVATDSMGLVGSSEAIDVYPFRLSIPKDLSQWEGQLIDVPVNVSDLSGLSVGSGFFRFRFDANCLQYEGMDAVGTLTEGHVVTVNQGTRGRLLIAFAGAEPLVGQGVLMKLRFRVVGHTSGSELKVDESLFNETLNGTHSDGVFSSKNNPYMDISPNQGELVVGETSYLYLLGAVEPYQWSVSDDKVATIDAYGTLNAVGRGNVVVTAVDSTGTSVSTRPFTVYDTRIHLPDTAICDFNQVVYFSVVMEKLPTKDGIYSFECGLTYDTTQLKLQGMSQVGTGTEGWSGEYRLTFEDWNKGVVSVAFSGTQALSEPGTLFYFLFKPQPGFTYNTYSYLDMNRFLFNEGTPTAQLISQGTIRGQDPYSGFVRIQSEGSEWICQGDSVMVRADAYNIHYPVYQWRINGVDVPGATLPHFITASLTATDSVSCQVIALDPCIIDPILLSNTLVLDVRTPPLKPDSLAGDTLIYKGYYYSYTALDHYEGECRFDWQFPSGFDIIYENEAAYIYATDSAKSGWISVVAFNDCGVSDTTYRFVRVINQGLSVPLNIYGPTSVSVKETDVLYWVDPIPHVTWYEWVLPNGFSGSSLTNSIWVDVDSLASSGSVSVRAFSNDSVSAWVSTFVSVNAVGIKLLSQSMKTFPNPFRETLHVQSELLVDEKTTVTVYDVFGRRVTISLSRVGSEAVVRFGKQASGFYMVVVDSPQGSAWLKVLKQ